jgi:hypothetical protein
MSEFMTLKHSSPQSVIDCVSDGFDWVVIDGNSKVTTSVLLLKRDEMVASTAAVARKQDLAAHVEGGVGSWRVAVSQAVRNNNARK